MVDTGELNMNTTCHAFTHAVRLVLRRLGQAAVILFLVAALFSAAVVYGQSVDIQIVYTGPHESTQLGSPIECTSHLALCQYGLEDSPLGGRSVYEISVPDQPGTPAPLAKVSLPFTSSLQEYWQIGLDLPAPIVALGKPRLLTYLCFTPMRKGPLGIVKDGDTRCEAPRWYEVHPSWEGWVPGLTTGPWWSRIIDHDPINGQLHIRLRWTRKAEIFSDGFESGNTSRWSSVSGN